MISRAFRAPGAHAFLDESKQRSYVVAVTLAAAPELEATRQSLRKHLLPGQSAIHFKHENQGRKNQLIRAMNQLPVTTTVYVSDIRGQVEARRTFYESLGAASRDSLRYDHLRATAEPLLWVPDAVAWAWCRGGQWRRSAEPLITATRRV